MLSTVFLLGSLIAQPVLDRNPATVSDVYALESNPAGLGFISSSELRLLTTVNSSVDPEANASLRGAFRLGDGLVLAGQVSWVSVGDGSYGFVPGLGAAMPLGALRLGLSWTDAIGSEVWRYGASLRPTTWLSSSLSRVDFSDDALADAYDLGIGLRPLGDEGLTLSARWRYQDTLGLKSDAGKPDVEIRVDLGIFDGLLFSVASDLHANIYAELGITLGELSMHSGTRFESGQEQLSIDLAIADEGKPGLMSVPHVLVANLSGNLNDAPSFGAFSDEMSASAYGRLPLFLAAVAGDEHTSGLYLQIGGISAGWARAAEIRSGIATIRKANKRVDCYLYSGSDLAYYLAAACDSVSMPPSLILGLDGLSAESSFKSDFLHRLGFEVNVVAAGKYKSAPEEYSRTGMSREHREVLTSLIDAFYDELTGSISKDRAIDQKELAKLIEVGTQTASQAKSAKLIDHLAYADEMKAWLRGKYAGPIKFRHSGTPNLGRYETWGPVDKIVIVSIDAQITGGQSDVLPFGLGRTSGAQTIIAALESAKDDSSVRAVVLRVDSPGGGAFASDLIARAVHELAQKKPVIASFGDVAASGGYYAAAHAHVIYAEPTTITGSIGVFSVDVSAEALRNKLGINVDVIRRGSPGQGSSGLRRPSEAELQRTHKDVQAVYQQFLQVVSKGRKMKIEAVEKVAQGRVWTGEAALKHGLVDHLGGFFEAFARAKSEAGIAADAPVLVVHRPKRSSRLSQLVKLIGLQSKEPSMKSLGQAALRPWLQLLMSDQSSRIMAMMPFGLQID